MCKEIAESMGQMKSGQRKDFLTALVPALTESGIVFYKDGRYFGRMVC